MNTEPLSIPYPTEELESGHSGSIGVVGLGFLGRGIAACFLAHGFRVVGCDRSGTVRQKARRHIEIALHELVEHASFAPRILQDWQHRYRETDNTETFFECIFVVESVTEDLAEKRALLHELERVVDPATVIAGNTSAIRISELQAGCQRPDRIVGMHWAEPAYATRFLEIIRGEQTSEVTLQTVLRIARTIGKDPCLVAKDIPAFVVNRLGYAIYREVAYLLELGVADADTIDRAFRNAVGLWALACGPLRWIDLTGGPVLYAKAMERVLPDLCNSPELPPIFRRMTEENAQGITNGRGFYRYTLEEAEAWQETFHRRIWKVRQELDEQFPLADSGEHK